MKLWERSSSAWDCTLPQIEGINGPDDFLATPSDDDFAAIFADAKEAFARHAYGGGWFELRPAGVWFNQPPQAAVKKTKPASNTFVCSRLYVRANSRDQRGGNWGKVLEWRDIDRTPHLWNMPCELLQGTGLEVRSALAAGGLVIAPTKAAQELLPKYISTWPVEVKARSVENLGWNGSNYVFAGEVIGSRDGEPIYLQPSASMVAPAFAVSGTVEEWKTNVASLCAGSTRLVFTASCGFTGPLLYVHNAPSGGFHLLGLSSIGKTLALRIAASLWGDPFYYMRTWRATSNGLEGIAQVHNDGCLILDEFGQVDGKVAGEIAYMLANGKGKSRASRNGGARAAAIWRLVFLSSGETSLQAHMQAAGKKVTAGQEVRMVEIPADAGKGFGVIEDLHGFEGSEQLVEALYERTAKYYGAVGVEFVRRLVLGRSGLDARIKERIAQFTAAYTPKGSTGQVWRVCERFALVSAAGSLATEYGLTGWEEPQAEYAAATCFYAWLDQFGKDNREESQLLAQVKAFFETHGGSRFEDVRVPTDDSLRTPRDRAGFYRVFGDKSGVNKTDFKQDDVYDKAREFLVLPQVMKNEICRGFDFRWAVKVLRDRGWIIPDGEGKSTHTERLPGIGSTRVYVFGLRMWQ